MTLWSFKKFMADRAKDNQGSFILSKYIINM